MTRIDIVRASLFEKNAVFYHPNVRPPLIPRRLRDIRFLKESEAHPVSSSSVREPNQPRGFNNSDRMAICESPSRDNTITHS